MSGYRAKSIAASAAVSAAIAVAGPVLVVIALRHSIPMVGIALAYLVLFLVMAVAATLDWHRSSRWPTARVRVEPRRRAGHHPVDDSFASRWSASDHTVQERSWLVTRF